MWGYHISWQYCISESILYLYLFDKGKHVVFHGYHVMQTYLLPVLKQAINNLCNQFPLYPSCDLKKQCNETQFC